MWDPKEATKGLLEDYKTSVSGVPAFQKLLASLEVRGQTPQTTQQLLEYYYSSVTVVRIPAKGRYMQIDEQLGKLQNITSRQCAISHESKREIRMLLNAERLPQYINAAYDHFCYDSESPFDFVEEARRRAPLPSGFGGHILNLIRTIYRTVSSASIKAGKDVPGVTHGGGPDLPETEILFKSLTLPIASCVILAATRDGTQGMHSPPGAHGAYYFEDIVRLTNVYQALFRTSFGLLTSILSKQLLRNSVSSGSDAPLTKTGNTASTSSAPTRKATNPVLRKSWFEGQALNVHSTRISSRSGKWKFTSKSWG